MADEGDWIALRELVPAGTAPLRLVDPALADRTVTLATVLPLALPSMVRENGDVLLGLQVHGRSGDVSRDLAHALELALAADPGSTPPVLGLPGPGPRLQDLVAPEPLEVTVRDSFDYWLDDTDPSPEVRASLERANAAVTPTHRLKSVTAAYWELDDGKAHLRWVFPVDEDALLDAMARLAAIRSLDLGADGRYVGSFRAHGRGVPVWDLPSEIDHAEWEEPAAEFDRRLSEALADDSPLTDTQRRAREGLRGRQFTLR